jgi:ubiquinone biosynthesis protein
MAGSLLRTVYQSTRTIRTVVQDASRARNIATILAKYGFAALLDTRKTKRGARRRAVLEGEGQDVAARAVAMLEELGPTFVKFGQILSTRPDIIPPRLAGRLQTLQDHVQAVPVEDIRAQIEAGLGAPPEELFTRFDEEPIASASIAQVHGAETLGGREVVVKVQRPNLRPTIEADLSLLRFFVQRVLDAFPEATLFDLEGMVREFERSLMRELDFEIEAESIDRFAKNFVDKEHIHIPHVFHKTSCKTVLTMERIEGQKLTELPDDAELRREVAEMYLDGAYQMLFEDGFFHGDLHPGNVFLEEDGRLGVIDFGMVGRLSKGMRQKVVDVIYSVIREDLEGVAKIWYAIGRPEGRIDYPAFEAQVVEVLERTAVGRPMERIDIGGLFRGLAGAAVANRIRLPADFTMMFKAMVTTEGLAKQIAEGINPVEAATPYIEKLIKERYSLDRLKNLAATEIVHVADLARELPGRIERILVQAEAGELEMRVRHEDIEPLVVRMVRARNRTAVSIVTAAAGIVGAMTLEHGSEVALGLGAVTLVSFGISLIGAVWLGFGVLKGR